MCRSWEIVMWTSFDVFLLLVVVFFLTWHWQAWRHAYRREELAREMQILRNQILHFELEGFKKDVLLAQLQGKPPGSMSSA